MDYFEIDLHFEGYFDLKHLERLQAGGDQRLRSLYVDHPEPFALEGDVTFQPTFQPTWASALDYTVYAEAFDPDAAYDKALQTARTLYPRFMDDVLDMNVRVHRMTRSY